MRIVVRGDLERSRLTVFFRFFLSLPHLIVLLLWSSFAFLVAFFNWFAIVFSGRPSDGLHRMQAVYLRYLIHVDAYLNLAADPFPSFGAQRAYPIDLEVPAPAPQNRWKTGFRFVLAVPALLMGAAFGAAGVQGGAGGFDVFFGVVASTAFLAWFVALARGRITQGLRDLLAYGLSYSVQVAAYVLLVTDRYPDSDPRAIDYPDPAPDHPVRVFHDDDLRRSRLTVFFRLLLALPHFVWLLLWSIVAFFVVVANWFVTLFAGRPAASLHRFLVAYLRYATHVTAFFNLVANPFPGFVGRAGSYPMDVDVAPPARQNRWKTGFRLVLAIPALILTSALANALGLVALFGWFTGVFLGRIPRGLVNLGVFATRYQTQAYAYLLLLTDRYPFSGPSLELRPRAAVAPHPT